MSRRKKTPQKKKGVRYIARVLQKYGGKKYKKYSDALVKSRSVLQDLQSKGEKVKVKTVLGVTQKHRVKKRPELYYKLQAPEPYFSLIDYPVYINNTTNEITFVSDLFNTQTNEVQGGQKPQFKESFSQFVGFLNKKITDRTQAYDYRVMATPPEQDPQTKKWVSKIIAIDPDGQPTTFQFTPTPVQTIGKRAAKPIPKQQPQPKREKSEQEIIKELDLKILKEKSRQQANEMFIKGLYSKKEYKDEIDRINKL